MAGFLDLEPKLRNKIYGEVLRLANSGQDVVSVASLQDLDAICRTNDQIRDEFFEALKISRQLHPLNLSTFKKLMNVELAGTKVLNLDIQAMVIYYEKGKDVVNLSNFLSSIDWNHTSNIQVKQAVVDHFGARNPGSVSLVEAQHVRGAKDTELYNFKGEDWSFTVRLGVFHKNNKVPTMGAAFQSDLCRLEFFQADMDYSRG